MLVPSKMKTKLWKFDPVIYPFNLLVCKYIPEVTDKEIKERFYSIGNDDQIQEMTADVFSGSDHTCSRTIQVSDKVSGEASILIVFFHPEVVTDGTKAHEALHFATMLGDWLGFPKVDLNNDEPYAYIVQWVADCMGSVLNNTQKRMKGELYV